MKRFVIWAIVPVLVVVDIATKRWIVNRFDLWEGREVLGDFLRITRVHNPGAAFGIFQGFPEAFTILTGTAIVGIALHKIMTRNQTTIYQTALSLILSGAIGNIIDRLQYNYVVDFVDVGIGDHRWPAFNVADSAISIGVVLLILFGTPKERHVSSSV